MSDIELAKSLQMGVSGAAARGLDVQRVLQRLGIVDLSAESVAEVTNRVVSGVKGADLIRSLTRMLCQDKMVRSSKRPVLTLHGIGLNRDREIIAKAWGSAFDVKFSAGSFASLHTVPRAMRDAELARLAMLAYRPPEGDFFGSGNRVKLLGEKAAAIRGAFGSLPLVGVAAPVLDTRDYTTRNPERDSSFLEAMRRRGKVDALTESVFSGEFMTDLPAQDDLREADILVARQVYFDGGPRDLADAMNAAGARIAYGSLIFPKGLAVDPRVDIGTPRIIADLGCSYVVCKDSSVRSGYSIRFGMGELANGYVHDLQSYLSMGYACRVDTPHGSFAFAVIERYGDIIIYSMTRIPVEMVPLSVRDRHDSTGDIALKAVRTWRLRTGQNPNRSESYESRIIHIPADDWNRLGSKLLDASTGDAGRVQEAVKYLVQVQKTFIMFGKPIREGERTHVHDLLPLAAAAVVQAAYVKATYDEVVNRAVRDIGSTRRLADRFFLLPVTVLWEVMRRAAREIRGLVVEIGVALGVSSVLKSWYDLWFTTANVEANAETVEALRSLDKSHVGTLSSLVELKKVYVSDRKYGLAILATRTVDRTVQGFFSEPETAPVVAEANEARDYVNNAVDETKRVLAAQCRDATGAVVRDLFGLKRLSLEHRSTLIRDSWSVARNKERNLIVALVDAGKVIMVEPRGARADHMFAVPMNSSGQASEWIRTTGPVELGSAWDVPDGEYMFSVTLELCVCFDLLKSSEAVPSFESVDIRLKLVEGVAGGGKTHRLVKELLPEQGVLTASRVNKRELSQKIESGAVERNVPISQAQVQTFDSFLINPRPRQGLVMDEGFLRHPGYWFIALWLSDPSVGQKLAGAITVYGDRVQIRWNSRGLLPTSFNDVPEAIFTEFVFISDSYRCAGDSIVRVRPMYLGRPVYTFSAVRRSVGLLEIRSIEEAPIFPGVLTICFTNEERDLVAAEARKRGMKTNLKGIEFEAKDVVTIGTPETLQGQTRSQILIIRGSQHASIAYQPSEQRLVADTRHTHELLYVHVKALDDKLLEQLSQSVTDEQIGMVTKELPKGGYSHVPGDCHCGYKSSDSILLRTGAVRP